MLSSSGGHLGYSGVLSVRKTEYQESWNYQAATQQENVPTALWSLKLAWSAKTLCMGHERSHAAAALGQFNDRKGEQENFRARK